MYEQACWRRTENLRSREVRDNGVTSAAAEAFSFLVADAWFAGGLSLPTRIEFDLRLGANPHGPRKLLFQTRSVSSPACILVII